VPVAAGRLIELTTVTVVEDGKPLDAWRLWVVDTYSAKEPLLADETCVYALPCPRKPKLGEQVWWYDRVVFFGDEGVVTERVWTSHPAPGPVGEA
jgi:hypothetical protein